MNLDEFASALDAVEFVDLAGPVDGSAIDQAARNVGVVLPPQYRRFIERFGGGGVGSESIIGLCEEAHLRFDWMAGLLRTQNPRLFPNTLIPIRNDGYGNYDCVCAEASDGVSERMIVEWTHDGGIGKILAGDFFSWLDEFMVLAAEDK